MAKNLGGRPTDYREEICEEAFELCRQGASIEELGYELRQGYTTLYEWMDRHPKFAEAIKKGREQSKGWWLKKGRENIGNKEFNSGLWFMNMKNRWGWADKRENTNQHNVVIQEIKDIEEIRKKYEKEI